MEMTTKQQGIIGEAQVLAKFESLGIPVSIPFGDNLPYDMIIDVKGKLYKVQVKTSIKNTEDKIEFGIKKSRINTQQNYITYYNEDEVDFYALYSINRQEFYLVPFEEASKSVITIRYNPPKNKQINKVKMNYDYTFEKILKIESDYN